MKDKLYLSTTILLCLLVYSLNICTAIYQCALVFTLIATIVNFLTFVYDKAKSLRCLIFAAIISFIFSYQIHYYIDGKIVNNLILVSLLSLTISISCATSLIEKLNFKYYINIPNYTFLVVAGFLDSVIMSIFLLNNERVLNIFTEETLYKIFYSFVLSCVLNKILHAKIDKYVI